VVIPELRHDVGGEPLERLADVGVPVAPALLDEDGLVDAGRSSIAMRSATRKTSGDDECEYSSRKWCSTSQA